MAHYMYTRDVIDEVTSAPETFTSWDKCMQKTYCKWPAIVGIVVGSLILLSFIWCVARCLCCGAQLCSCCCGGCGSCCPSGGNKRDRPIKYQDDYTRMPPTPYSGYQPTPSPMAYGHPAAPQFATFDDPSSRKINEDSLPPMPSWDTAVKRRVEDTSELPHQTANGDLEMGHLTPQPQTMRGGYNSVPHGPLSPMSPNPQGDYFNNTGIVPSHSGDLGAQRMNPTGGSYEPYDNFHSVPLSPPPTYRSNSNAHSTASDKFMTAAASPSPNEYNRGHQPQPYQQPASYAPSQTSTRYEPSHTDHSSSNRISMPSPYGNAPSHSQYQEPQQYQTGRPPSFLQVGRKPVHGSFREV